jgi:tRNA(Ile)-lysidine synthase
MLPVVHDPMNDDIGYRRVWLRREVLPVIEAGVGRDLRAVIARQATVLQSESELLDRLARAALDRAGDPPAIAALAAEEPAIARRAIRLWLAPDVAPPSQTEVDAVVDVAGGSRTAANLAGGDTVFARRGHLERRRVVAAQAASRAPSEPVAVAFPGTTTGLGWILESWVERAAPLAWPDGRWTCVVDADAMPDEAELRSARPAERFQPLGMAGTKTVATARAESGVAPGARGGGVVVATTGEVLWVVGYRIAERLRVTPRTRRYLWIAAINAEDSSA